MPIRDATQAPPARKNFGPRWHQVPDTKPVLLEATYTHTEGQWVRGEQAQMADGTYWRISWHMQGHSRAFVIGWVKGMEGFLQTWNAALEKLGVKRGAP